jgi:ABC-type dipeptide/oligopeptide/nickel transport system ATPase component
MMSAGRLVGTGPTARPLDAPSPPYTRALVGAVPDLDRPPARLPAIPVSHRASQTARLPARSRGAAPRRGGLQRGVPIR